MNELERVRYLTRYYHALQGLKMVPFGIFMILLATRGLGWNWLGQEGDCTFTLPLLLVGIAMYFAVGRYYDRQFGVVQPTRVLPDWLPGILFLSIFFGAVVLEVVFTPPFSLIGVTIGGLLIWVGLSTKRGRYLWAGAAIILFSLLSVFLPGDGPQKSVSTFGFLWNFLFGLVWVLLGLLDHFMLVKQFKALRGGSNAQTE